MEQTNPMGMEVGEAIGGYRLVKFLKLPEISSFYYNFIHADTRARHIHIQNQDKENTFSVAFKTVPADSTGVAHILEHTVLCGSEKFPVRDPFFSMLKRSLSTFMNAFTASDWTMYPFSTQNRKDFYNLMDVYLDATFFPRLDELSFKQEGHRMEVEGGESEASAERLVYKGVVYNEMKGAMSSQDQVMVRSLLNSIYPSTTYQYNSGGDPAVMPSLTYEQLKQFHARHYHPSNAFFYTYGNLPVKDHLAFVEKKVLRKFGAIEPGTDVPSQPRWEKSRKKGYFYPISSSEDTEKKGQVCVAWLTADVKDAFEVLTLSLLEQILIGNSASPVRKALIDSQLGSALCDGCGFDADNRDTLFAFGLKGVNVSDASRIESIVLETLEALEKKGIDPEIIESAIHQMEFYRREITNSPYPFGIKLLLSFSAGWFHGGEPERILQFDADLERLHREMAQGLFFEKQIRKYFLDNTHRVLMTLEPDKEMAALEEKRVAEKLKGIKEKLGAEEIEKLKTDAEALRRLQESEENISCLPTLERGDIAPDIFVLEPDRQLHGGVETNCFVQPTSGIFYFTAAAGAGHLPASLLPLVPLFCSTISRMGTNLHDYTEIAKAIDRYTGGVGLAAHARVRYNGDGECLPFVSFEAKCLDRNIDSTFDIIRELFLEFSFHDHARLKNLLLEYRSALESAVVRNGHRLAISLASRNFASVNSLSELWNGVHQLKAIREITEPLSGSGHGGGVLEKVAADLQRIGGILFDHNNLKAGLVGEEQSVSKATEATAQLAKEMKTGTGSGFVLPAVKPEQGYPREGWSTSTAVSFVAGSFQAVRMADDDAAALAVLSKLLRSMYLHREIREKGGAYGGFSLYNPENGVFSFASYRDPHIRMTLQAFEGAAAFGRSGKYGDEDVKEAILQVASEIDKPDAPGTAAKKAFYRGIVGLTDDTRRRFKKRILALTREDVVAAAERYLRKEKVSEAVAVISSEELLKAANEQLSPCALTLYRI